MFLYDGVFIEGNDANFYEAAARDKLVDNLNLRSVDGWELVRMMLLSEAMFLLFRKQSKPARRPASQQGLDT